MGERNFERILPPLALGPGGRMTVSLPVQLPSEEGSCRVEVWSTDGSARLLASREVVVESEGDRNENGGL